MVTFTLETGGGAIKRGGVSCDVSFPSWLILKYLNRPALPECTQIGGVAMNENWPGGYRHAMHQLEHESWNAAHYPGTRQLCSLCFQPTGRCEEDSMYLDGPVCEDCFRKDSNVDDTSCK